MFILRHIQLIVVLTDKDEKCWEKFHEPNVFSGESFVRPGGIPKNPRFCPNSRKKRGLPAGSKLACMAVIVVDKFDARGGEWVIQGSAHRWLFGGGETRGHSRVGEILL